MTSMLVRRGNRPVDATVTVPGDKSISHRVVMCAAMAKGTSTLSNLNGGADVLSTIDALRAAGVDIKGADGARWRVHGTSEFVDPTVVVDCGNSGSTMRMLAGLFAGRINAKFDGDASLRRRPMERVAEPLRQMGADVATADGGRPPLVLRRTSAQLHGIRYRATIPSAQVKTAILFAALRAESETSVAEMLPTRDHTERLLQAMGADVDVNGATTVVRRSSLRPLVDYRVPNDFSAAFFFIAGAAAVPDSKLLVRDVGINPTRTAALDVLQEMGARIELTNRREALGEPVADIRVSGGDLLRNVAVTADVVPNLIDEIPALCALAAYARGQFSINGSAELRTKESDRIATTAALLRAFGADVNEYPDGLAVCGGQSLRAPGRVETHGDHRIGMSAALLTVGYAQELIIDDADCIATSFPDFASQWFSAFG